MAGVPGTIANINPPAVKAATRTLFLVTTPWAAVARRFIFAPFFWRRFVRLFNFIEGGCGDYEAARFSPRRRCAAAR
jgi:hypothetical protein